MTYAAPVQDMRFVLHNLCNLDEISQLPELEDATPDMIDAILDEAAKYAGQELSPLNRVGDLAGLGFDEGKVTMPEGWAGAYETLVEMGWNSPSASPKHGGMGLPYVVNACIQEMFQGANMAFQLCPMLTQGAIEALEGYASEELQNTYLPKLVTGEWTGTMNLTEPQAGSDLAAIRSKATPDGDHYRIKGQKIYITHGEHDLTANIIHLVLARLPDAPAGVKGISLFLVPKILLDAAGAPGEANDVRCVSIEHKLGIHASPTCSLSFGDNAGAIGYLIGEPNRGLEYMFAMMNSARLNVGLQGIGVAEHALQDAARYAADRKQGGAPGVEGSAPIILHPDIRRMLGIMKSRTEAARILAYRAAASLDFAHRSTDPETRAFHQRRVDLLIPVVKGGSTEMSIQVASLGMQVHGGMGYVEETGVAQHLRDARITTIYEGTTGIQALDLIGRKILRDKGAAVAEIVTDMRASAKALKAASGDAADWAMLSRTVAQGADAVERATAWILASVQKDRSAPLASAANVLELFNTAFGAWAMGDAALAAAKQIAGGENPASAQSKIRLAEFFARQVFPDAQARLSAVLNGAGAVLGLSADDLLQEA
ncbi:acyl-CoA dehydrogenase [Primorskyibacter aestuariivivens]|uniref:acyl-CoA dehydrogenase n=1 Tax=Primorskyibacter aestuariivivens TaxID=1888912 RepID=UPI002300760B|nr:acyl-CoA dehydrogenase [Primorskyibacter aestuariivivens]MDA7429086.1 acyl-CoA dehydrogenase [Primorskyibacter aestuariivivens]